MQKEIKEYVVAKGKNTLEECLTAEGISELIYLNLVVNESMRYEAPLNRSTTFMMTEDLKVGPVNMKANDIFIIDFY